MFKSLIFFVRFFLIWLLFFAIDRIIFILIFQKKITNIPISELLFTFYHALRLDLSMAAYLAVIPLILFIYWYLTKKQKFNSNWVSAYNKVLVVIFSILGVINFNIYREWGTKVNARALSFAIDTPNEAFASSVSSPILLSVVILAFLLALGFYIEFKLGRKIIRDNTHLALKIIASLLLLGSNFLIIRGGIGVAPNSQSMAYFSKFEILNHASLNTEWNLLSSILASKKTNKNPYLYFEDNLAQSQVKELYQVKKDTTINILSNHRPNVILIILESFTADLTKTLGNEPGITPNFDSLINEGVLFTNIYSAGNRTDKGMIATLTGFPTLGTGSIVKWPEKMQKIPAISQQLNQHNYQTSFYYGGESEFDNYKAFILSHSYQKLVDKNNFDSKDMNSKWGAYDGLVFTRQLTDLKLSKQPFFSTILTLTNHEPFEVPGKPKFGNRDLVQSFKSTAFYTDSCLKSYLSEAKKQPWYKNTLFVFVADHGHLLPKNSAEIFDPKRYHIPLLFYGDVIKNEYKGKKFNDVGSQQDVPATLLAQLKIPHHTFVWSKNLLNPYIKPFAFFSWDNGFGFVNKNHSITFDNVGKNVLHNSNAKSKLETSQNLKFGQSYLQAAYQQFIKL